jgi:hypothetical protein
MEGIIIGTAFAASKKAIKAAVAENPSNVTIHATSAFTARNSPVRLTDMAIGQRITFVGPDPYRNRKFYGTITRTGENAWKVA